MDKYAVFQDQPQGARQDNLFNFPPFLGHRSNRVRVVHCNHDLGDYWTVIQTFIHEMSCRANYFDAPSVRLFVRICANERGQEGVMNI